MGGLTNSKQVHWSYCRVCYAQCVTTFALVDHAEDLPLFVWHNAIGCAQRSCEPRIWYVIAKPRGGSRGAWDGHGHPKCTAGHLLWLPFYSSPPLNRHSRNQNVKYACPSTPNCWWAPPDVTPLLISYRRYWLNHDFYLKKSRSRLYWICISMPIIMHVNQSTLV